MKLIYVGIESSGKTLLLAKKVKHLLRVNRYWLKKHGFLRKIYSNLNFSENFYNENKKFIEYWSDYRDLLDKNGMDVIWDEISTDFSALKKEPLPKKVNRWLRQGAKQGVHIYSTAQEFHDVHLDFRRRTFEAYEVSKLIGSPRGGDNLPKVKRIWGLCTKKQLKIRPYNELKPEYHGFMPGLLGLFRVTKSDCEVFDTHQLITEGADLPLDHRERFCPEPSCQYHKKPKIYHY